MAKTTRRKLAFSASDEITILFKNNSNHQVFKDIENQYNVELKLNSVGILVAKGDKSRTLDLEHRFKEIRRAKDGEHATLDDLRNALNEKETKETAVEQKWGEMEFKDRTGRVSLIKPKNEHQKEFIDKIINSKVIFGMGSAGTGKTFLAVAVALKMMENRRVQRIIVSRPAVEAGRSIGFLPGSADEKLSAYLMPIFSIIEEIIGKEKRDKLLADKKIEILPIAFARGISVGNQQNEILIIDEAQNLEFLEHKLLLSRLGNYPNSKLILCGDQRQSDLKAGKDTFSNIHNIVKNSPFVSSTIFTKNDIVRSEAVKDILGRIEDYEDQQYRG